jgi:hypothetical protein
MQAAGEMDALDRHVGGQDEFMPTLDRHQRSIIANAEFHPFFKPQWPHPFIPVYVARPRLEPLYKLVFGPK